MAKSRLLAQQITRRLAYESAFQMLAGRQPLSQHSVRQRYASTTSKGASSAVPINSILGSTSPPTAPRSKSTRYLRTLLKIVSFFFLGSIGGTLASGIIIPPPLPIPDSDDDAALLSKLKRDASALNLVRKLRSPESKSEGWIEYEAFMGLPDEIRDRNMTAGALRGTRAFGLRRMWWNRQKRELVGVIFLGGGVAGWPGVVHGGALATVLLDAIATVGLVGPKEIRGLMTGGNAEDVDQETVREFGIRYLTPTNANRLYILRAEFQDGGDQIIECWLEDASSGRTTVKSVGKVGEQHVIALGDGSDTSDSRVMGWLSKILPGQA